MVCEFSKLQKRNVLIRNLMFNQLQYYCLSYTEITNIFGF